MGRGEEDTDFKCDSPEEAQRACTGCCAHSSPPVHAMDMEKNLLAAGTVTGCWVEGRDLGYKNWD